MLSAYVSFTASSSGVEQHFSKVDRCHLERGNGNCDSFRRSVIALADDGNEASDQTLVESARRIYAEGRQRLSQPRRKRRDAGVQRASPGDLEDKSGLKTEADWLRKRRRDLDEAITETPPPKRAATMDFTPEMQREAKHLKGVLEKRRMEAQANGSLLNSEKTSAKNVEAWQNRLRQEDAKRIGTQTRKQEFWDMAGQRKPRDHFEKMLAGKTVWLGREVQNLRQACLNYGVHAVTSELSAANVFLVDSLNPEKKAQWAAALQGGTLISQTVLEPQAPGIFALHFRRGTAEKCVLHMTPAFMDKNPSVSSFLRGVVLPADPGSAWTLSDEPSKAKVVLCVSKEMKAMKKRGRTTCTAEDLLTRVARRNLCPAMSGRS